MTMTHGLELHAQLNAAAQREIQDNRTGAVRQWCSELEALLTSLQASATERERQWREEVDALLVELQRSPTEREQVAEARADKFESAWRDEEQERIRLQEALRVMTAQLCGRGYVTQEPEPRDEGRSPDCQAAFSAAYCSSPEPSIGDLAARLGIPPEEWEAKRQATLRGCAARDAVREASAAEDVRGWPWLGLVPLALILVTWVMWQVRQGLTWPGR